VPWTGTAEAPEVSVNVLVLSVAGSIASLKVTPTLPLRARPLAPFGGLLDITDGAVGGGVVATWLLEPPQAANDSSSRKAAPCFKRFDFEVINIFAPWR
jgi:hypothetical protein